MLVSEGRNRILGVRTVFYAQSIPLLCETNANLLGSYAAIAGGQVKLPYFMYFPLQPSEAALSIFRLSFLVKDSFFFGTINENKGDCH
jgi:hypothetical protein